METSTVILDEYDSKEGLYIDYKNKCEAIVRELLQANNILVHETTARVKTRESLSGKLNRPNSQSKYTVLCDITDIVGIRIITYFNDEVDIVARIIEKEFAIDNKNSIDKRAFLDPDQFGYLSLHYVAKLPESRLVLTENQRFQNCVFEVQIRSILQHTWAEIQHDLGYKSKIEVPRQFQRRFSRLAGLLELADEEFAQIRDGLDEYRESIQQAIDASPQSVLIDQDSLEKFIRNDELVKQIDDDIVTRLKGELSQEIMTSETFLSLAKSFGIQTIAELQSVLSEWKQVIPLFAQDFAYNHEPDKWLIADRLFPRGVSLFYLTFFFVLHKNNGSMPEQVIEDLRRKNLPIDATQKQRWERAYQYATKKQNKE